MGFERDMLEKVWGLEREKVSKIVGWRNSKKKCGVGEKG